MAPGVDTASPPAAPTAPPPSRWELFLGFTRIAAFSFGGVLPWARYVLVEKRRWLSAEEFTDMLALCQLLPGPNICNMSVAIGSRFRGPVGALASLAGLLVLPVALVLSLATLYGRVRDVPAVDRALDGMAAAAAGLVIAMTIKIGAPLLRRHPLWAAPVALLTFAAVALLRLPLWPVILALGPLGVAAAFWERRRSAR